MNRWMIAAALSVCMVAPVFGQANTAPAPKKAATNAPANAKAAPKAAPKQAKPAPVDPRLVTPLEKFELTDGDTVVFLGDSITHQSLYTQYIEDYYYQRFPKVRIRFHNSGVGGDRASDALARFDQDVAAYKPKYVTVLLGMNDGGYKHFDRTTFDTYEKDMLTLIERIKGIGATPILMGPTMHDSAAMLIKPNPRRSYDSDAGKYYNAVLAFYGTYMRDVALRQGLGYVDMFAALNKATLDQRINDPNFTLIPDAVHPDANGQAVMATAILDSVHPQKVTASVSAGFEGKAWKVTTNPGSKATDVSGDAEKLTFTYHPTCLPWVLPPEAATGFKISVAGHRHSQEILRVQGLTPGRYELKIDGQTIGTYTSQQLGVKIELQAEPRTPQYKQALAVAMLNKEKNDKAMRPIRDLYRGLKLLRRDPKATPEKIEEHIADMKPKIAELEKLKAEYEDKIYAANQPVPHTYQLTRVATN